MVRVLLEPFSLSFAQNYIRFMKHTRTLFLFLFAYTLLPAQTTVLFERVHFKLLKIETEQSIDLLVQDKIFGAVDQVIISLGKGHQNLDSAPQISCNDSLISFIDSGGYNTNWRTVKYFLIAEDKEYPQKFFLYTKESFWPGINKRDYPDITNDSLKAIYVDCWDNANHWKHINNTVIDWDHNLILPGCYPKEDRYIPSIIDRVLSYELLDPFTLKRRIKRYTNIDKDLPSLETIYEQIYHLDVDNYGSKLIAEQKID